MSLLQEIEKHGFGIVTNMMAGSYRRKALLLKQAVKKTVSEYPGRLLHGFFPLPGALQGIKTLDKTTEAKCIAVNAHKLLFSIALAIAKLKVAMGNPKVSVQHRSRRTKE